MATRPTVDTRDIPLRQAPPIDLSVGAKLDHDEFTLETVNGAVNTNVFDELKFMEDLLELMIHPSATENPAQSVFISVNGEKVDAPVGVSIILKRKFVEVLARSRTERLRTVVEELGLERSNKLASNITNRHAFQILKDPAGVKGREWIQRALA